MRFSVYCDESRHDLLSSKKPHATYMLIGGVWLPAAFVDVYKTELHQMRDRHKVGGEFKWSKCSPSRVEFYLELVEWFFSKGEDLRFRVIAVDNNKINLANFHDDDQELGFYKFYYQLLHHWILDFNEYAFYLDYKSTRLPGRLETLRRVLSNANLTSKITRVQPVRSEESVFIQLADVLIGAAGCRLNSQVDSDSSKGKVVEAIEGHLGRKIHPTSRAERKFNVFAINLQGGW